MLMPLIVLLILLMHSVMLLEVLSQKRVVYIAITVSSECWFSCPYTGREIPRPGQWNTDVITWTRLVFRRPQPAFSEGDDKPRSRESPPPSPGHAYDEEGPQNGIPILVQFPVRRAPGVEQEEIHFSEDQQVNISTAVPLKLPPPVVGSEGQPSPVTEEILPPPGEFSGEEEEPGEGSATMDAIPRNSLDNRAAFGPRAVSEPPRPTPPMEDSSSDRTVQQGVTMQLPSGGDNQYIFSPPK